MEKKFEEDIRKILTKEERIARASGIGDGLFIGVMIGMMLSYIIINFTLISVA